MKTPQSYQLWLQRRLEEGNDLDRCRRQIEAWKANPPADTNAALFDAMLAELDGKPKKAKAAPRPAADVDAFG